MTLTCPQCGQGIVVTVTASQYEVRVRCPRCGKSIIIEVGAMEGVGPSETKRGY
jgi:transcription elongation factor Elf1